MNAIDLGDEVYEEVPDEARIAVTHLLNVRNRIGITDDTKLEENNKTILKYALEVYKVWAALYPHEHAQFIENTKEELKYERPVKDAVKAGGYSPTSYPMRLERLYSILLPGVKIQDKRFWKNMFNSIPELKRSSYA